MEKPRVRLKLVGATPEKRKIEDVWTKKLAKPFTAVSSFFIDNHHRLKYPVTPTEFMLIVHLLSFKWDERMPWPSFGTLAKKMNKSEQAVRSAARSLEKKKYLKRHFTHGRPNHYDLRPLYEALEVIYDSDAAKKKAEEKKDARRTG